MSSVKRVTVLAMIFSVCLSIPALAQVKSDDFLTRRDLTRADIGRVHKKTRLSPIRALLLTKVDRVSWDEEPVEQIFEWLRGQSTESGKVNILPRWRALEVESIDKDTPVSLTMEDTTVAEVLDAVLDQLTDIEPLTYIGVNNNLKISTKSDFDRKLFVRAYNVEDIFFEIRNFTGSPQINLNQRQQSSGGGGGGAGGRARVQSIFGQSGGGGNNDNQDDEEEDEEREEEILEMIRTTIEPDSWEENGGLGSLSVFNKMLFIRNTLEVHELLGGPFYFDE
jgi:hypothetical protein